MSIRILAKKISADELQKMADDGFGDMVKGVVDIERKVIAINGEMHADCEKALLENGSQQKNLWGFNIYPDEAKKDRIIFQSLINIRPKQNNRSMSVEDKKIQRRMRKIIDDYAE